MLKLFIYLTSLLNVLVFGALGLHNMAGGIGDPLTDIRAQTAFLAVGVAELMLALASLIAIYFYRMDSMGRPFALSAWAVAAGLIIVGLLNLYSLMTITDGGLGIIIFGPMAICQGIVAIFWMGAARKTVQPR